MCEILVTKYNKDGIMFTKEDIKDALEDNNHGCGYILFEKNKKRWDILELSNIECFDFYVDYDKKKDDDLEAMVDFEVTKDEIELINALGTTATLEKPKGINENTPKYAVRKIIEEKCELLKIKTNFDKNYEDYRSSYYKGTVNKEKSEEAVERLYTKQFELKKNQMLIMHFRNATTGYSPLNTQPIVYGNFAVIHNGVFSGSLIRDNSDKSDTRAFTEYLHSLYYMAKESKINEERIINELLKQVDGWYSIFIYSWESGKLYYRKDNANFNNSYNGVLMSTKAKRFPVISMEQESLNF